MKKRVVDKRKWFNPDHKGWERRKMTNRGSQKERRKSE